MQYADVDHGDVIDDSTDNAHLNEVLMMPLVSKFKQKKSQIMEAKKGVEKR